VIFFTEIQKKKKSQNLYGSLKDRKVKTILNKKSNAEGITIPGFKLYYSTRVTKAPWYWHRIKHVHQYNTMQ
jgi:hypothetical protein